MFSDLVTNLDLVVKLKAGTNLKDDKILYNAIKLKLSYLNNDNDKKLKEFCAKFRYNNNKKWENANRKEQTFKSKYSEWLESHIVWPEFMKDLVKNNDEPVPTTSTQLENTSPEKVSVGTSTNVSPRKPFTELGPKQKKRRTEHTMQTIQSEELSHTHVLKLKAGGNEDIADILQHLLKNPQDVQKVKLILTMVDGKATAILCNSSSQRCDICKATPKEMNDLPLVLTKEVDANLYRYGLSSLLTWIRFMECILHIAYRLDLKTWIVRGDSKAVMESRKKNIQEAFKSQTGLLVDVVKQGHGTTNDGNTARRFFEHSDIAASITGVNEKLIKRFRTILEAISSGHHIDTLKFKEYTDATMKLYVDLYNWFYMLASVHKFLAHGAAIIENLGIVPIGKLSEEAAEARNKDFRRYRAHHSRKFCRKATNEDIMNNLLISSDPHISKIRPKLGRKHKALSEEAKALLIVREETFNDDNDEENIGFLSEDPLSFQERESEFSE